jgi:uncharacterized protein (TIGR02646 family)
MSASVKTKRFASFAAIKGKSMRHFSHPTDWPASIRAEYRAQPRPANPRDAWDAFDTREVRDALWELQHGLCAYCERVVEPGPGSSSIDHVIPKSANPEVTFLYTNHVLCCTDRQTCNLHKKGQHFAGADATGRWTQGFIAPTQPRCETSFIYEGDGSVKPSDSATEPDTTETLRIVNLNHGPLQTERRDYLTSVNRNIANMADQMDALLIYLEAELSVGSLKPFYSLKRQCIKI